MLAILALIAAISLYWWTRKRACTLPGPTGLPIIGYLPFLSQKNMPEQLYDLSKTYGDIYQLSFGQRTVLVLNSREIIDELLNRWEVCGRPNTASSRIIETSKFAFRSPSSPRWADFRKAAVRATNNFTKSTNVNRLNECMQESTDYLFKQFDAWDNEKGEDLYEALFYAINSVSASLSFGHTLQPDSEFIQLFVKQSAEFITLIQGNNIADIFPVLEPLTNGRIEKARALSNHLNHLANLEFAKHEYSDSCQYLLDAISDELVKPGKEVPHWPLKEEIKYVARDIFFASTATITDNLLWAVKILAKYQSAQTRLRDQLKDVDLDSAKEHPLLRSCVHEVLRFSTNIPLNLPHWTTSDFEHNGHFIPKDCLVFTNLYAVNSRDDKVFTNPQDFVIDRFIDENGDFDYQLSTKVWTFGWGKRKCVGETLAKLELYSFLASIIMRYQIDYKWYDGDSYFDNLDGFSRRPKPCGFTITKLT